MVRKWEAMYNMQKILGFSMVALLVAAPSVGFASSMLTSQDYVDSKIHGTGTLSSSSTTTAPSEKMVYDAIVAIDGDAYTGTGLIDVTNHVISTTAQANVIETVKINNNALTPDANKAVNIPLMGGAAAGMAGTVGLVPASSAGDQDKFLKADGTWAVATASVMTGANGTNSGTSGLVPAPAATDNTKFLRGDGTWAEDNNTTYSAMTGADGTNSGTSGLVPAPAATDNTKFLKGDGTWATVDALPAGSAANQMLQYDGTDWDVVNIDTTPTAGHTVPVTSGGIATALAGKQDNLGGSGTGGKVVTATDTAGTVTYTTVDTTPTSSSNNLVTSGGVYDVVNNKQTKPSSGVANGKVLTYTGSDVDTQVSAAYVTLPVATGAPSTNTPSSFAEVWIQ